VKPAARFAAVLLTMPLPAARRLLPMLPPVAALPGACCSLQFGPKQKRMHSEFVAVLPVRLQVILLYCLH
jgi:hypothetical protein